jgi:tetratricopeptide (TPR) repeat protein
MDRDKHIDRGNTLRELQRYQEAAVEYRAALALQDTSDIRALLAYCLLSCNLWDEASKEARLALKGSPGNADNYFWLGWAFWGKQRWKESEDILKEGIRLAPNSMGLHGMLGCTLVAQERWCDAEACYREALRLDPSSPACYADIAYTLLRQHEFGDAIEFALQGLEVDPSHANSANLQALTLLALGRTAEAASKFENVLAQHIKNAQCYTVQGWLALRKGDEKACRELFAEAVGLDPTEASLHRFIQELESSGAR